MIYGVLLHPKISNHPNQNTVMKKKIAILSLLALMFLATACESMHHTCPAYRGSVAENVQR